VALSFSLSLPCLLSWQTGRELFADFSWMADSNEAELAGRERERERERL